MLGDFQFSDFIILNVNYKARSIKENENKENELEFAYDLVNEESTYSLSILTHIINLQEDHLLDILVEVRGNFVFDDDVKNKCSDKEKTNLIKTNGSAIMFPYIRSLIFNLTSADSHGNVIILPTINFAKVIENIDNRANEKSVKIEVNKDNSL